MPQYYFKKEQISLGTSGCVIVKYGNIIWVVKQWRAFDKILIPRIAHNKLKQFLT